MFSKANMCVFNEKDLKENLAGIRVDSDLSEKYVELINTSNENMVKAYMYIKQQYNSDAIRTLVDMIKVFNKLGETQDTISNRFFDIYYEMFNEEFK